jgi:hypothetical protein
MPAASHSKRDPPTLPTELVQKIIQLVLPLPTFTGYTERYAILLQLCQVSRMWRMLAQQELLVHARIRTARDAGDFMEARSRSAAETGAWTATRSLWVDAGQGKGKTATSWSTSRLSFLLDTCERLTVLRITLKRDVTGLSVFDALEDVASREFYFAELRSASLLTISLHKSLQNSSSSLWRMFRCCNSSKLSTSPPCDACTSPALRSTCSTSSPSSHSLASIPSHWS